MAKQSRVKQNIQQFEQIYFTHDEPVPLKDHLLIYPVLVKDYNLFYSLIDIFTINKNEDPNGISMSHLDYFIYLMQPEHEGSEIFTRKVISMFELIFHIKNGIRCVCDHDNDTYMSYEDYDKLYDFLETHRGIAPRRNGVTIYPSGASKGAFDVFINNRFAITMVFYNEFDLIRFLNEDDGRFMVVKNFLICEEDIKFNNKIHRKGRKK